jgi:hypothetical protein
MHLLVVISIVGVSFQLSGKNILNFPSDDEISVRITLNVDRWIKTRESQHFQPLDLLFHSSILKILLIVFITNHYIVYE